MNLRIFVALFSLLFIGACLPKKGANLPESKGKKTFVKNCLRCHTNSVVQRQPRNREGWEGIIALMQRQYGLGPLEPDTKTEILDYLEKHYSPKK